MNAPSPAAPRRPGNRLKIAGMIAAAAGISLVLAIGIGEWLGWPFLAAPLQQKLSAQLNRQVAFAMDADSQSSVDGKIAKKVPGTTSAPAEAAPAAKFGIRFIGGVHIFSPHLHIAAPDWSSAPHLVIARNVALDLRYIDLWRAYRGEPVRIDRLQADMLDANLERQKDGRASWQFSSTPKPIPSFGYLQVTSGTLRYQDAPLAINIEATLSLTNGASVNADQKAPHNAPPNAPQLVRASSAAVVGSEVANVLRANAVGKYGDKPVKIELLSSGVLPWAADETHATPVPLTLDATVGRANLRFNGSALDILHLSGFSGHFSLKGPSLAAVGDAVGVTLPTTGAFRTDGVVVKKSDIWHVVIEDATVGASRLNGAFTYDAGRDVRLLSGRLGGSRLLMVDLGPVVGTTTAEAAMSDAALPKTLPAGNRKPGMLLPDRPFDLPAMRAMDANVLIDIREVDLNSRLLEPLRPLQAHLQLNAGVLRLSNIDARTGQGKLTGNLKLDGRATKALWDADLRWSDVRLEKFVRQTRANNLPPYLAGRMSGRANLKGQGRSTAEILGSLSGTTRTELREGTISHLVIEAAGIDLAQALGVMLKGDDALPVQCAVVDLVADGGIFRPKVMVLDTSDSAVWVEGSLSLATEALNLCVVVTPKDFSPLALRTPLLVTGTFADPRVTIEKGPLGRKLATAFLLSLVNPLAALIPLVDPGDAGAANRGVVGCQNLMQRTNGKLQSTAASR